MHGQQNIKNETSVPQNEPTGFGQWQTFHNLKPNVKPTRKDVIKIRKKKNSVEWKLFPKTPLQSQTLLTCLVIHF